MCFAGLKTQNMIGKIDIRLKIWFVGCGYNPIRPKNLPREPKYFFQICQMIAATLHLRYNLP